MGDNMPRGVLGIAMLDLALTSSIAFQDLDDI
jgi:hypothetical protein